MLDKAARLSPATIDAVEMRSLAAACLGAVDLRPAGELSTDGIECFSLAFDHAGKRVAAGRYHGILRNEVWLFDVASRVRATYTIPAGLNMGKTGVRGLAFSPNGRWLAAGTRSARVYVWDTTAKRGDPTVLQTSGAVVGLAFTQDGQTLIAGSAPQSLQLWDVDSGWKRPRTVQLDFPGRVSCR